MSNSTLRSLVKLLKLFNVSPSTFLHIKILFRKLCLVDVCLIVVHTYAMKPFPLDLFPWQSFHEEFASGVSIRIKCRLHPLANQVVHMDTLYTDFSGNYRSCLQAAKEWRTLEHQILQVGLLDFIVKFTASEAGLLLSDLGEWWVPGKLDSCLLTGQFRIVAAFAMPHHKDKSVFCPRLLVVALLSLLVCALIIVWLLIVVLMMLGSVLVLGVGVHFIKIITQRLFLSKSFSISILRLISSSTK